MSLATANGGSCRNGETVVTSQTKQLPILGTYIYIHCSSFHPSIFTYIQHVIRHVTFPSTLWGDKKLVHERGLPVLLLKDSSETSSPASLPSLQGKGWWLCYLRWTSWWTPSSMQWRLQWSEAFMLEAFAATCCKESFDLHFTTSTSGPLLVASLRCTLEGGAPAVWHDACSLDHCSPSGYAWSMAWRCSSRRALHRLCKVRQRRMSNRGWKTTMDSPRGFLTARRNSMKAERRWQGSRTAVPEHGGFWRVATLWLRLYEHKEAGAQRTLPHRAKWVRGSGGSALTTCDHVRQEVGGGADMRAWFASDRENEKGGNGCQLGLGRPKKKREGKRGWAGQLVRVRK